MKLDEGSQLPLGGYESARSWIQRKLQEYARQINRIVGDFLPLAGGTLTGPLVASSSTGTPVTITANNVAGPNLRLTNAGTSVAAGDETLGTVEFYSNDASASSAGVFGKVGVFNAFSGAWDGTAARVDTYMSFSTAADGVLGERVRIGDTGDVHAFGQIRAGGWAAGTTVGSLNGAATEIGYSSGEGYVIAYDRGGATYKPLNIQGTTVTTIGQARVDAGSADEVLRLKTSGNAYLSLLRGSTREAYIQTDTTNGFLFVSEINKPIRFRTNNIERGRFSEGGDFILLLQSAAPSLTTNYEASFNLTSDTNLRISVRGSDGTTRVANITLA